jgi:hypothetical protein
MLHEASIGARDAPVFPWIHLKRRLRETAHLSASLFVPGAETRAVNLLYAGLRLGISVTDMVFM